MRLMLDDIKSESIILTKLTERDTQLVAVTFVLANCLPQVCDELYLIIVGKK